MELYLDSANLTEIEEAFKLGFLYGLTTTPTFMHRDGHTDIDATIVRLAQMVPVLQVEALGRSKDEIIKEAHRLLELGLDPEKTVFKIPISLEGASACRTLVDEGLQVNLHLIYTVQQAYIAMSARATYICPLVGRLQDQGHDALSVVEQCVDAVNDYGYPSKIMFSSVRHAEHVRNAINIGVHACTIPWKVLKQLAQNHFTDIGTQQFFTDTRLISKQVRDVIRDHQAVISADKMVLDAMVDMTQSKLGAVTVLNGDGSIHRVFTDGDLRRLLETEGGEALHKQLGALPANAPHTVDADSTLQASSELFRQLKVDTLVVRDNGRVIGMLDIQDLLSE
ncbi:MAG: transaldolase family protein [Saprospiraceae bacterium]|nr:transaldolase family protein [Saprospiraceae bacterium]